MPSGGCGSEVTIVVRKPCAQCQRLWSAQTLVTVGAAELCPVCYKQRRWARGWWPCRDCTLETDRTLVCHDKCPRYAMYRALIWAGKPSKGDRAAAEVTLEGKLRSIRHRGTGKIIQI